ncbi:MAG: HDOD domain-containing protein [Candidatus Eisenbacteria bacterium]|uniref:HDOD domain-containing protein n=1 Tax=Eiseniibacteriota bacterium TaxID=2212470 RepID=A0A948RV23_UNCEI|nr:HDOD domain-containing protein [Candidatus Eisenbacteria bacterium]MBU1950437.1 HDOD domain-containing protein [Candidatus Eisenbacteria bacterium]MBU2690103.1 HDOD domain-containing protein [Candidatus Eisenbacteria bacterium]
MGFKFIDKIRRHAAVSSGNFGTMFKDVDFPPLPEAATKLIEEVNKPDPDLQRIVKVISSSPETAACVIRTVNSSFFALRNEVRSVKHAVTLLGLKHIRPIALSYAVMNSLPHPKESIFNHKAFWSDSLIRAIFARALARRHCKSEEEEAFTAMLLADLALPVLMVTWGEYYMPIIEEWKAGTERLSEIEQSNFKWNHAQAAAWVMKSWGLPEELICYVGLHNALPSVIRDNELEKTIALPMAVASMFPSSLRDNPARNRMFIESSIIEFSLSFSDMEDLIKDSREAFSDIQASFHLTGNTVIEKLDSLIMTVQEMRNESDEETERQGAA